MADTQAGIMALPENQDAQVPTLSLDDSYDAVKQALSAARPDAAIESDAAMSEMSGIADELSNEELGAMIDIIQYLYDNKDQYKQLVSELITDGIIEQGDLPEEYDPEFLSTFGTILLEERKSRGTDRPPFPEKFARGGIAEAARIVANQGRYGDTMLAHITPEEARMLRKQGGSGTINPVTGLPEFVLGLFKAGRKLLRSAGRAVSKHFKRVVNGVKKVLASPIGRIVATVALTAFLGPAGLGLGLNAGATAALASGTISLASGENIKDALKSAAFSYFTTPSMPANPATGAKAFVNPVHDWVGKTTAPFVGSNQYVRDAVTSFGTSTAAGLLTGQKLEDAVKGGLTDAAISTGVSAVNNNIDSFKTNATNGAKQVDQTAALNADQAAAQALQSRSANPNIELARDLEDFLPANQVMTEGRAGAPVTSSETIAALAAKSKANLTPGDSNIFSTPNYAEAQGINQASNDALNNLIAKGGQDQFINPTAAANVANAPARVGAQPIGASIGEMGSGIADLATGDFSKGYNKLLTGAENLFFPSGPTPEQIQTIEGKYGVGSNAAKAAIDAATPGTLRTYAPIVAAGTGIAALGGAFDRPEPPKSELEEKLSGTPGEDLIAANPDKYIVQNIPGVNYDPSGNLVYRGANDPNAYSPTLEDIRSPTASYNAPSYSMQAQNQAPVGDPYAYYYNQYLAEQQPRRLAMGGITSLSDNPNGMPNNMGNYSGGITGLPTQQSTMMSTTAPSMGMNNLTPVASRRDGGTADYPRRIGQIAGPGTEKSDSIPAMLSDGEFVMTAAAVRGMGAGSRREGAKRMYALMHQLERNAARG
jgi:hypothetical protein